MIRTSLSWMQTIMEDCYHFLFALFFATIGFFIPVKNIVHLMLLLFFLDVIFGYWAARKLRKEKFKVKVIWSNTIPRAAISIVLVLTTFMWDSVFSQNIVSSYNFVGWFISGILIFSIAKNGYLITKWGVFVTIGDTIKSNLEKRINKKIEDCHEE